MKKRFRALKVIGIVLVTIMVLVVSVNLVCFVRAKDNYRHNQKIWDAMDEHGLIYRQSDLQGMRYGFGSVVKNGCGAVAVYNILTLENQAPSLPKIIKQFDNGGENLFGWGGSNPSKVIDLLKDNGFHVKTSLQSSDFAQLATNAKYSIFVYAGIRNGVPFGHYQLMYDFDGEQFTTLNKSGTYTLDEICNVKNTIFRMMIAVNV